MVGFRLFLPISVILALFLTTEGAAQQTFDRISNRDLLFLIRDNGFEEVEYLDSADDDSWTRIQFKDQSRSLVIYNYRSGNLMLVAYYINEEGETNATLRTINQWNQNARWTRAYIDSEGDWTIESDLDLTEGVTDDHIEVFIETFAEVLDDFENLIDY